MGCDYKVCAAACNGLSVTADQPWGTVAYMGSTIHCWNISESGSISNSDVGNDVSLAKQKADEATLAMGCGHSSKAGHGGTYYEWLLRFVYTYLGHTIKCCRKQFLLWWLE